MNVKLLKTGRLATFDSIYAVRLIEQGLAIVAPEKSEPAVQKPALVVPVSAPEEAGIKPAKKKRKE